MTKHKRYIVFSAQIASAAVLALADQWIKRLVAENLPRNQTVPVIKNLFGLYYSTNTGGAWSMLEDNPKILYTVSLILLLGVIVYLFFAKFEGIIPNVSITLIIGGGAGNMIDRLFRGEVVDYIQTLFVDFPIYNLADIFIVVGCFMFIGYLIYDIIREEKQKKKEKKDGNS